MRPHVFAIAASVVLVACAPPHGRLIILHVRQDGQLQQSGDAPFPVTQLPMRLRLYQHEEPKPDFALELDRGVQIARGEALGRVIRKSGYSVIYAYLIEEPKPVN